MDGFGRLWRKEDQTGVAGAIDAGAELRRYKKFLVLVCVVIQEDRWWYNVTAEET